MELLSEIRLNAIVNRNDNSYTTISNGETYINISEKILQDGSSLNALNLSTMHISLENIVCEGKFNLINVTIAELSLKGFNGSLNFISCRINKLVLNHCNIKSIFVNDLINSDTGNFMIISTDISSNITINGGNIYNFCISSSAIDKVTLNNPSINKFISNHSKYLEEIEINDGRFQEPTFTNDTFKDFIFTNGVLNNLRFEECNFINNLIFAEGGYTHTKFINNTIHSIIIYGGNFSDLEFQEGNIFRNNFQIQGGMFQHNFTIKESEINAEFFCVSLGEFDALTLDRIHSSCVLKIHGGKHRAFIINDCDILELEILLAISLQTDLSILKVDFTRTKIQKLTFFNGKFNNIYYKDSSISILRIYGGQYDTINYLGENKASSLIIEGGNFESVFFNGGVWNKIIKLHRGNFTNITVTGTTCIEKFQIDNEAVYKSLKFQPWDLISLESKGIKDDSFPKINTVEFNKNRLDKDTFTIFEKVYFHTLLFNSIFNIGSILMVDIKPGKRILLDIANDYTSYIGLKGLDLVEQVPTLKLENSDIGKAVFINCDLSKFEFNFKSSKITDAFSSGTQMPEHITGNDYSQKRLGYSQLKKIYENRGDKVEANKYFAREMEAYQQTLSWGDWADFWEKLNLGLNKISTYYGQSWQRGLLSTLLISAFFYCIYCWLLGFKPAFLTSGHFTLFSHVASYFLEFINPIHKADYVAEQLLEKESPISGWARIIEGVSRIFIAYFVYQLIQAFRKHGKSSG